MPRRQRSRIDDEWDADGSQPNKRVAFVTYHGPHQRTTAAARRVIHQQAMKDIGKTRRKPRNEKFVELDLSSLQPDSRTGQPPPSWWLGVRWTMTDSLNMVTKFNVELDAVGRTLIANIFADEVGGQQRALRDAWFSVGLSDEAAFLTVLSNSALHLNSMQNGGAPADETGAAVKYQTEAVAIINKRLADGAAEGQACVSDETIGAITGLVCNADIRGSHKEWDTHLKGLQELLYLRGGVEGIETNEFLRVTISWVELQGALMFDVPPLFPIPRQWHRNAAEFPVSQNEAILWKKVRRAWASEFPVVPQWLDLFEDMSRFSHSSFRASSLPSTPTSLDHTLSENGAWTNSIIHKLLSFRPCASQELGSIVASRIQESCRLGCLLYMIPVWRLFGVAPVISGTLLANLHNILQENNKSWGQLWMVELWVLYMAAVEALDGPFEAYFIDRLASLCLANGIISWDRAMVIVKEALWFACLFNGRDRQLRERINLRLQIEIDI